MAKEKVVTQRFTSDISGEEAAQTVAYSVNGIRYEIDVTEVEAKEFHEVLAPYISVSRVRGQRSGGNGAERKAKAEEVTKIRAWAAGEGITLPSTGRIPNEVRQQYVDAHSKPMSARKAVATKAPAKKTAAKKAAPRKRSK